MNLMIWAVLILVAFIAVWFFIVVPAEKKHHERKLESLRSRIEKRESSRADEEKDPKAESRD